MLVTLQIIPNCIASFSIKKQSDVECWYVFMAAVAAMSMPLWAVNLHVDVADVHAEVSHTLYGDQRSAASAKVYCPG